jgi:hypothetical protein
MGDIQGEKTVIAGGCCDQPNYVVDEESMVHVLIRCEGCGHTIYATLDPRIRWTVQP